MSQNGKANCAAHPSITIGRFSSNFRKPSQGQTSMAHSATNLMAILFGLGVFLVIVAVGWRSVQNRRIMRLQGPDGDETIIVAGEDDEVSSVATST